MPAKRRTRPPHPSEAILRDFQDRGFQWLLESPSCLPTLFGVLESLHPTMISLFDVDRAGRVQRTILPPDLRRRENDALYTIPFRSDIAGADPEIPALVVVEHKSRPDPMAPLQTLQYQVAFWAKQAPPFHPGRTEAPRLSPPITVLVYTGEEPWNSTYRLSDVFGAPSELLEAAPLGVGPVLMLDLPRVSEEALRRLDSPLAQALRLIQLERAAPDLYAAGLAECLNRLAAAPPESHPDVWRVVWFAVLQLFHRRSRLEYTELLPHIREWGRAWEPRDYPVEEIAMPQTMADFVREEGIRIGEARGLAVGEARGEARGLALGEARGEARGLALGEARGRSLGGEAVARGMLVDVLETKFGGTPPALAGEVQTASAERCSELTRRAAASSNLDEFLRSIRS